ncbi:MAG: hypothetical protein HRT69_16025 [Flavobacteriaceae bacterium]|nr:hypothetical protein [Flavobacteriaceae bacterium]
MIVTPKTTKAKVTLEELRENKINMSANDYLQALRSLQLEVRTKLSDNVGVTKEQNDLIQSLIIA